jgi:hypothetical protein
MIPIRFNLTAILSSLITIIIVACMSSNQPVALASFTYPGTGLEQVVRNLEILRSLQIPKYELLRKVKGCMA